MNYWVTCVNGSRESGVAYWNDGATGRAQSEVTDALVDALHARTVDYFVYTWLDEPADSLQRRFDGMLAGVKRDDIVFIQLPLHNYGGFPDYLLGYLHNQVGAKCVGIIHDIHSWQRGEMNNFHEGDQLPGELTFLAQFDGLIVHNDQMAARLRREWQLGGLHPQMPLVNQELFGYSDQKNSMAWRRDFAPEVDFAGNLSKAGFLTQVDPQVRFNVFGQELETDNALHAVTANEIANITYRGNYDPEAIVQVLPGSFGLCWSSTTYPGVTGAAGDYERFNSPYKAGMYLAADEPLIVARQAAISNFVEKHGLGLVIDDLSQLADRLNQLTADEYGQMQARVHRVGNLIRTNYPIKRAAIEMINQLEWQGGVQ